MNDFDYLFKLTLVEDSQVGKTTLHLQFLPNRFTCSDNGIGVEYKDRVIQINDKTVKLRVWDTVGQEKFNTRSYYKGSHGVILVYSIADRKSFENIGYWLAEAENYAPRAVKILVGHKSDLENNREVTTKEGEAYADQFEMRFIETSAHNKVNEIYYSLTGDIMTKVMAMKVTLILSRDQVLTKKQKINLKHVVNPLRPVLYFTY